MHSLRVICCFGIALVIGLTIAACSSDTPLNSGSHAANERPAAPKSPTEAKSQPKSAPPRLLDEPTRYVIARKAIQPHVAVSPQGNVYVAFIQNGNIVISASTDRGKTFGDPVVAIDVEGHARGGRQRGPRIGVDAKNKLIVTAPVTFDRVELRKKYPRRDLYLVSSNDGGKTWTQPIRVNEQPKKAPEALHWLAVAPSGTAHVAWLDLRDRDQPGQDIYYAKFANGRITKNIPVARTVCECCAPGLSVDSNDNPILAFREGGDKDSRELFARYSGDGGISFAEQVQINQKASQEFG